MVAEMGEARVVKAPTFVWSSKLIDIPDGKLPSGHLFKRVIKYGEKESDK